MRKFTRLNDGSYIDDSELWQLIPVNPTEATNNWATWDIFYDGTLIAWHKSLPQAKALVGAIAQIGVERYIHLSPKKRYTLWKSFPDTNYMRPTKTDSKTLLGE